MLYHIAAVILFEQVIFAELCMGVEQNMPLFQTKYIYVTHPKEFHYEIFNIMEYSHVDIIYTEFRKAFESVNNNKQLNEIGQYGALYFSHLI